MPKKYQQIGTAGDKGFNKKTNRQTTQLQEHIYIQCGFVGVCGYITISYRPMTILLNLTHYLR